MKLQHWQNDINEQVQGKNRLRFIFWLTVLCFLAIILRTIYLQIYQADYLKGLAKGRNSQLRRIPTQKGSIITKEGSFLAVSVPVFSIYADPSEISNYQLYAAKINEIIPIGKDYIAELLKSPGKFVWIQRFVQDKQKQKIADLNFKGLSYVRDFKRLYPAQDYLASVLGFSGRQSQGLEGMEHNFDAHLSNNIPQPDIWDRLYGPSVLGTSGGNLRLTINDSYQHIAKQELIDKVQQSGAQSGMVIVMESKTGALLAVASHPVVNPNIFGFYHNRQALNPFVGGIYEPGSTFKIITLAIALDDRYITEQSTFNCYNGQHSFFGQIINDTIPLGISNLADIIKKSSNICAAQIGLSIPSKVFYEGITRFGFLRKTGINLLGEVSGQLRHYDKWKKIDQAILSYGHGIGVSPLQMITAINVIANDGVFVKPYVIEELLDSYNNPLPKPKNTPRRVVSSDTASLMKSYMKGVVSNQGTARLGQIKGLKVAGKTGTARKFDRQLNSYSKTDYILSFIGFLPADNPKFTILTLLDDPKKAMSSNTPVVTPLFRDIALRILTISDPIAHKTLRVTAGDKHLPLFK
ncbi:MAG: penicillin-binding protein 2 [SAR324 cluster bacterium]|nr:penicillin-binding protein 2 [SAR324 cluster bacterium]